MARRPTLPVTLLTLAAVAVLILAAWPAPAAADDDWKPGRSRRHGRWHERPKVVRVVPAPVVVVPPVVVAPAPGYVWVPGHYEAREETRWVPGPAVAVRVPPRFEVRWVNGRFVSVEIAPGYYEYRAGPAVAVTEVVEVWVPGHWVPAARAVAYRAGAR